MTEILRERVEGWTGWTEYVWHVEPPPEDVRHQVLREEWDETTDPPERHIYEWRAVKSLAP